MLLSIIDDRSNALCPEVTSLEAPSQRLTMLDAPLHALG
jgi:hypothetical protein